MYPTPFELFYEIWDELKHQFQADEGEYFLLKGQSLEIFVSSFFH